MALAIKVKLIGGLRGLAGKSEIGLKPTRTTLTVSEVVSRLCRKVASKRFEQAMIDSSSETIGPNIVVLVNDKDISVLQGLRTQIGRNDTVTLIPVAHGG